MIRLIAAGLVGGKPIVSLIVKFSYSLLDRVQQASIVMAKALASRTRLGPRTLEPIVRSTKVRTVSSGTRVPNLLAARKAKQSEMRNTKYEMRNNQTTNSKLGGSQRSSATIKEPNIPRFSASNLSRRTLQPYRYTPSTCSLSAVQFQF